MDLGSTHIDDQGLDHAPESGACHGFGVAGVSDVYRGGEDDLVRIERADPAARKGWYAGPWNSDLTVAVGYANEGIDDPHLHVRITEVYLIARGWSEARIERETVRLGPGDMLVVEMGEAHTFLANSPDYLHFVLHVPGLPPSEARNDRVAVPRSRLT